MGAIAIAGSGGGGSGSGGALNVTGLSFYVRTPAASCTISAANPGVVTATAHGLQVKDPVAFSIIRTWVAVTSISNASPAVVTLAAHGLATGDPIAFINSGNGVLNTGITPNTTYYVTNDVNFSPSTFAFSDTQAHALAGTGQINTSSAGTGVQNYYRSGALPPNVREGQVYFVISTTANTFQFSATVGGPAIDCTGTQNGYFVFSTGNDSNGGQDRTRTGAFMTVQAAADYLSDKTVTDDFVPIYLADGTYLENVTLGTQIGGNPTANSGFGIFSFSFIPENVIIRGGAGGGPTPWAVAAAGNGNWSVGQLTVETVAGNGTGVINFGLNAHLFLQAINFGKCACPVLSTDTFDHGGEVFVTDDNKITGANQSIGFFADKNGYLEISHGTLTFCVNPQWPYFLRAERGSFIYTNRGDFTYFNASVLTGASQVFVDTAATILIKVGAYTELPGVTTNNMIEGGWVSDSSGTFTYQALRARTWYVSPSGSDDNDGTTSGDPFATIQHAVNIAARYNWFGNIVPTIQLLAGTYHENKIQMPQLTNLAFQQHGQIIGDAVTPSNVTIIDNPLNIQGFFYGSGSGCRWNFNGLKLDSPYNFFSPTLAAGFRLNASNMVFTDSTSGNNCTIFNPQFYGVVEVFGGTMTFDNTVGGTLGFCQYSSVIDIDGTHFVFGASMPHLEIFFCSNQSTIYFLRTTFTNFSGPNTTPVDVRAYSVIFSTNGVATDFPGDQTKAGIDATSALSVENSTFVSLAIYNNHFAGKTYESINTQTGASYTPALTDAGNIVEMNNAGANTFTIPANVTVAFPIASRLYVTQVGAGATTVSPAGGVTLHSPSGSFAVGAQWGSAFVEKRGTNEWIFTPISAAGGSSGIVVGATTVTSGSGNNILYDNAGIVGEVTLGANLTFAAGTLSATSGSGIVINTTVITGGTSGRLLYDNAGTVGEETISAAIDVIGATQGDILYRSASAWSVLAPGTSGFLLETQGAGANPIWVSPAALSSITVGTTPILSGTSGHVVYDNAGIFSEASQFTIISGEPNVLAGQSYLYDSSAIINAQQANENYHFGANSGNVAVESGTFNVTLGSHAGQNLTTGASNILGGRASGINITSGGQNILFGTNAGHNYTTENGNIGFGNNVMQLAVSTSECVGIGDSCMQNANGASLNVAIGAFAMSAVLSGVGNVAVGSQALNALTTGSNNFGLGSNALGSLTTGASNVAIGFASGGNLSTSSNQNIMIGHLSLGNTAATVSSNVVAGHRAMENATVGANNNVCLGLFSGHILGSANNVLIGPSSAGGNITTGSGNVLIGGYPGAATITNNIVFSDGTGAIHLDFGNTNGGLWTFAAPPKLPSYTVAGLPAAVTGTLAYVTDGTAGLAWGTIVTGGHATPYVVWYNGTNWTVMGT